MRTFKKVIKEETMKSVMDNFYKKDALEKLVNTESTTNIVILNLYAENSSKWRQAMDIAEHEALGELYTAFTYDYNMEFATNTMILNTEDNSVVEQLKEIGFKEV